ncbi:hypothetical protein [Aphanothece stagnina]
MPGQHGALNSVGIHGIGCDRFTGWQDGDRVEAYKLVTQRRTLST